MSTPTKLDYSQVIQNSYDEINQCLRVEQINAGVIGAVTIKDGVGAQLATVDTNNALKTINAATLVPTEYDYIALTYVPSGNGTGSIQTATYKLGGSSGTTQATLTLAYDGSNRLSSVTKA